MLTNSEADEQQDQVVRRGHDHRAGVDEQQRAEELGRAAVVDLIVSEPQDDETREQQQQPRVIRRTCRPERRTNRRRSRRFLAPARPQGEADEPPTDSHAPGAAGPLRRTPPAVMMTVAHEQQDESPARGSRSVCRATNRRQGSLTSALGLGRVSGPAAVEVARGQRHRRGRLRGRSRAARGGVDILVDPSCETAPRSRRPPAGYELKMGAG